VAVIAVGFQLFADPARNFGPAAVGEARQLAVVSNRHNARDDRDIHAHGAHTIDKVEVAVGVEKVLGNGAVGTGFYFADKVFQVFFKAGRLRVHLRVSRHFQGEVVAGFFPDKFHQFVGVAQFAAGQARAAGQIAAQGDDAVNAQFFIAGKQVAQIGFAVAHAGQVRGSGNAAFLNGFNNGKGTVAGGTAGTVSYRKKLRIKRRQFIAHFQQIVRAFVGFGREKFKT